MKKFLKVLLGACLILVFLVVGALALVELNQKTLLQKIQTDLAKNINGTLTIQKVNFTIFRDFPNLSITLQNALIRDSVYNHEVMKAGKIYCQLNLPDLLFKKIEVRSVIIEGADFALLRDTNGYVNANIFRFKTDSASQPMHLEMNLEKLTILKTHIAYHDLQYEKDFSLSAEDLVGNIAKNGAMFDILLQGFIHTDSMIFKKDKGAFLVDRDADAKLILRFSPDSNKLWVLPSKVLMDKQHYTMRGTFLFAPKPAKMSLVISSDSVNFNLAKAALSKQITEKVKDVDVASPVAVNIFIRGDIHPLLPPRVDAHFTINNGHIKWYDANLTHLTLDGLFENHVYPGEKNVDSNSALIFKIPKVAVNGVPASLFVTVTNLIALHVDMKATAETRLTALNQSIGPDTSMYKFTSGWGSLSLHYKGSIHYYLDTIKGNFDDTLSGSLKLANGAFDYLNRDLHIDHINADVAFTGSTVDLNDAECAINGNTVKLNGTVTSIRRIVTGEVEKMKGDFTASAQRFDLGKVLVVKKGFIPVTPMQQITGTEAKKIRDIINHVTDMLTVNIAVQCNEFVFRKISATNVTGKITASAKGLVADKLNFSTCKGSITVSGGLNTEHSNDSLYITAGIKNVDMQDFFKAAENFNQSTITDANLTGKLSAEAQFSSGLDKRYNVITQNMKGAINFSLKNGSLLNFEPIANVGKKVFRNRDFKDITFAEIKDSIIITGTTMHFKRMEISSSVMRLFMQGSYAFNGFCDLEIQFPLKNLRKQDLLFSPENIGTDASAGPSVYLHVHGVKDSVKIALDPMGKQHMKKEELAF